MLNAKKVDPVTQAGLIPPLNRLTNLGKLSIHGLGPDPEQQDRDLEVLQAILATWNPSISSRTLTMGILAEPGKRTKEDMLVFMGAIGQIVEEHCSGMWHISMSFGGN